MFALSKKRKQVDSFFLHFPLTPECSQRLVYVRYRINKVLGKTAVLVSVLLLLFQVGADKGKLMLAFSLRSVSEENTLHSTYAVHFSQNKKGHFSAEYIFRRSIAVSFAVFSAIHHFI